MRSITNYISKLSVMLSLLFLAGACDQPDYPEPNTTANTDARANILVFNTAPGSTTTSFMVDNVQLTALDYLGYTANYATIFGGQRLLEINGFDPAKPDKTIALRQAFNTNSFYTIFLTDQPSRAAAGSDPGGVRYLVVTDNLKTPASGKAGVRFLNVAPGTSNYGLYNTLTQQSILPTTKSVTSKAGTAGTISNFQQRNYREIAPKSVSITNPDNSKETVTASITDFEEVAAGNYNLDARTAPTGTPTGNLLNINLEAGKLYTVILRGQSGNATNPLGLSVIKHN
jgi:hypothetical protein